MTEAEWLADNAISRLFHPKLLHNPPQFECSPRKWRLLACGVCRHLVGMVGRDEYVTALEIGDEYADTGNPPDNYFRGWDDLMMIQHELENASNFVKTKALIAIRLGQHVLLWNGPEYFGMVLEEMERDIDREYGKVSMTTMATSVLCCILGNPYHPITADPAWLTSTVVQLAEHIYQQRAFDQLPIIADALQDAGCDNEDILNHCRQPGEHVRGCWVVDLVLGKS